jgi:hypothetical protein
MMAFAKRLTFKFAAKPKELVMMKKIILFTLLGILPNFLMSACNACKKAKEADLARRAGFDKTYSDKSGNNSNNDTSNDISNNSDKEADLARRAGFETSDPSNGTSNDFTGIEASDNDSKNAPGNYFQNVSSPHHLCCYNSKNAPGNYFQNGSSNDTGNGSSNNTSNDISNDFSNDYHKNDNDYIYGSDDYYKHEEEEIRQKIEKETYGPDILGITQGWKGTHIWYKSDMEPYIVGDCGLYTAIRFLHHVEQLYPDNPDFKGLWKKYSNQELRNRLADLPGARPECRKPRAWLFPEESVLLVCDLLGAHTGGSNKTIWDITDFKTGCGTASIFLIGMSVTMGTKD